MFTNLPFEEIGAKIRQIRGSRSQKTFGESVGASRGYVNNIEHGAKPSIEFLAKVCSTYGVSMDWLILDKGGPAGLINDGPESPRELAEMIAVLKALLNSENQDLQGWTKIQFQKTFGEYYPAAAKKK